MMAHDPKALQAILEKAAPPDMEVRFKPMFGGILAYAGGKPVASLFDGGLALKLSGADHADMLATPGAKPLRYAADQPASKSYVVVPQTMLDDPQALRAWIARAADGLAQAPKKAARRR